MADMDVDTDVPAPSAAKGKSKDVDKDSKKRFEVKKVRLLRLLYLLRGSSGLA